MRAPFHQIRRVARYRDELHEVFYDETHAAVSSVEVIWRQKFEMVEIHIPMISPATDDVALFMEFSSDFGTTWATTAGDYWWQGQSVTRGTTGGAGDGAFNENASNILLTPDIAGDRMSNVSGEENSALIKIWGVSEAAVSSGTCDMAYIAAADATVDAVFGSRAVAGFLRDADVVVNGVKLYVTSSGNFDANIIATGLYRQ